jgi:hypothetical protein
VRRRILALVGLAAVLVLASLVRVTLLPDDADPQTPRAWVVAVVFTAIGARVADRHRSNAVAWLLLAIGVSSAVSLFSATHASVHDTIAWVSQWVWWLEFGLIPFVLLLFPDGRLLSRRWRPALWISGVGLVIPTLALAIAAARQVDLLNTDVTASSATGLTGTLVLVAQLATAATAAGALAALVALFARYRRAGITERLQLKWLLVAGAVVLVASVLDAQWSVPGAWLVGAAAIPVAVGVAIQRYRLYEIDRIISRTLVYGLLTALLAGVYAGGVFVLGQLLSPGEGESQLAVAASTLSVAALFGPARRRIQRSVDRRFNRRRHDAIHMVEAFGARLRDELDLGTLETELLRVVRQTMEPDRVSLSLRRPPAATRSP